MANRRNTKKRDEGGKASRKFIRLTRSGPEVMGLPLAAVKPPYIRHSHFFLVHALSLLWHSSEEFQLLSLFDHFRLSSPPPVFSLDGLSYNDQLS